jgi:hypothetical protein
MGAGVADLGFQIVLDRIDVFASVRAAVEVRERQPLAERTDAAFLVAGPFADRRPKPKPKSKAELR